MIMKIIGALEVLCEVAKSGAAELIQAHISLLLGLEHLVRRNQALMSNSIIRKLRTKLISRVILRALPARIIVRRKIGLP